MVKSQKTRVGYEENECSHTNLAELGAVVKELNLSVVWKVKKLVLITDSQTGYHWVTGTWSGKERLKTKVAAEMLIRRRLEAIKIIVD